MTHLTEKFPYPQIKNKIKKNNRKVTVTPEEAKLINKWCRNPKRVKEVIKKYHIWCINHQQYADEITREWVKKDLEKIKKDLGIK